jgi:hypothetical protein
MEVWASECRCAALYHAGVRFAELWEFAGTSSASSPDLGAVGGGMWRGIQTGRLEAMDKIKAARSDIGKWSHGQARGLLRHGLDGFRDGKEVQFRRQGHGLCAERRPSGMRPAFRASVKLSVWFVSPEIRR